MRKSRSGRSKFSISSPKTNLSIVELTIGGHRIKCLIDSGSTTTLLNKHKLPKYKRSILPKPLYFNTHTCTVMHTSEDYCSDEHTLQKLKRQDMNCEETEKLEKLIRKNKDLFFRGGQKLSHAHEVQHEIVTQTVR